MWGSSRQHRAWGTVAAQVVEAHLDHTTGVLVVVWPAALAATQARLLPQQRRLRCVARDWYVRCAVASTETRDARACPVRLACVSVTTRAPGDASPHHQ